MSEATVQIIGEVGIHARVYLTLRYAFFPSNPQLHFFCRCVRNNRGVPSTVGFWKVVINPVGFWKVVTKLSKSLLYSYPIPACLPLLSSRIPYSIDSILESCRTPHPSQASSKGCLSILQIDLRARLTSFTCDLFSQCLPFL